jgi:hypothetical protein
MDTALVAAVIAAVVSLLAAALSWVAALRARRARERHHAWERLVWALRANAPGVEYDISKAVLRRLRSLGSIPEPDRKLAARAIRYRARHGSATHDEGDL